MHTGSFRKKNKDQQPRAETRKQMAPPEPERNKKMTKAELEMKCRFLEERLEKIHQIVMDHKDMPTTIGKISYYCNPEYLEDDLARYLWLNKD